MKFLFFILFLGAPFSASAYFQMDMLKNKQTKKQATQWTLLDWLSQKNKMSLADSWLAMNTAANLFELNLSGAVGNFEIKSTDSAQVVTTIDQEAQTYQAEMYIAFVSLLGEYEATSTTIETGEAYAGALGLRLFGTSSQTTSLVARYGLRKIRNLTTQESWENQFAEALLQLYVFRHFGFQGSYRHYFAGESNLGTTLSGSRTSGGAFLEFFILRIFANAFQEPTERKASDDSISKQDRSGVEVGLKLLF